MSKKALHSKNFLYESPFRVNFVEFAQKSGRSTVVIQWRFSVMFSRRFAVMSFGLMLFALCSVLHKVSSVPQGISDKKHNFVLCRAIFYLCGNRFRFLCFVISYKKAQKKPPGNKGVLPLYRAACCAVVCPHFKRTVLILSFVLF